MGKAAEAVAKIFMVNVEIVGSMNESRKRSIAKSILWRVICIIVSVVTSFLLTGNLDVALAIGTVYNAVTMVLYYFHERMWDRIGWGTKKK
jgi:uncharacterized membrane protein